jgi:5-methylcytosine-specific restriction endonuclease McrA
VVADHIIRRRDGGADALGNLRSLCRAHDNSVKEAADGRRRGGGRLVAKGCDVLGNPWDPGH